MVNSVVFATVYMSGNNKGHVSLYSKDGGFLSEYYDSAALHWNDVISNKPDEVKEIDSVIIQNNM